MTETSEIITTCTRVPVDITAVSVPSMLAGAEAVRTACDSKLSTSDLGKLTAAGDITLFTAMDSRLMSELPAWLGSWQKTSMVVKTSNDFDLIVFRKDFKNGRLVLSFFSLFLFN
ncbi:MAG: hypothetical protein ACI4KB_13060 [Oscillospiraceae bacterium]